MSNDDLNDDFDTEDFDLGDFGDDDFGNLEKGNTLADLWKNNPIVKFAAIGLLILFVIFAVIFIGGDNDAAVNSRVTSGSSLNELPGTAELTPAMEEAIQEENNRRIEQARRTGESVMPMPVEPIQGQIPMQLEEPEEEDPLERWRQMQQARLANRQVAPPPQVETEEPQIDTRTPAVNALAESMNVQVQSILGSQASAPIRTVNVSAQDYLARKQAEEKARIEAEREQLLANSRSIVDNNGNEIAEILVPAGTIEYAQMVTEANTDAPGPILAEIVSGSLKGARVIGTFSETRNYLTLNFNAVVLDGISYPINAVAIDPETTLPGLASDIDRRYMQRVVLPAGAAFIEGLTTAIAQSGTTTVTIQGETVSEETNELNNDQEVSAGIAEAGAEIGELLDEIADETVQLIRVERGTPVGILFVQPVFDRPITAQTSTVQ